MPMQPDEDKVDDAVWAALFHARPQRSAWKGFDWSAMNRPHDKGMIQNPAGKPNRLSSPKRVSLNHGVFFASCSPRQFAVFQRRLAKEAFSLRSNCAPYVADFCSSKIM